MNRAFPGRAFFASAYILLAIGFLTIHFTRVESFSTVVGGIAIKGRSSIGTSLSPPQIRRVRISTNGLDIYLRKRNNVILVTDDGIRHPLDIIGWEQGENYVKISLSEGAGFTIVSSPHDTAVSLIPEIPTTIPPVRSLEIPLEPENGVIITINQDRPGTLGILTPDMEYIASLPSDSTWSPERRRLDLVVLNKADPFLEITDDRRGGGLNAAEWLVQGTPPSSAVYEGTIDDWVAVARNGWKSRIDTRQGLWIDEKGEARWDDGLAAAILADAVVTGQLPSQLQSVLTVADRAQKDIGWLPSPYLGNIINQSRDHRQQLGSSARNLIAALEAQTPSFGVESALTALLDSGFSAEAALMVDAARQAVPAETPNTEIIDRLTILQKAKDLSLDNAVSDPAILKSFFDAYIIPRIFWVKDGLWLIEEDGSIDLNLSVIVGVQLITESQRNNDSTYQAVGRQLVLSALSYSDENGMIPAKLFFEGNGEVVEEGSIPPESLYPLIVNSPAYPRHVSLAKELGSGSWAITGAERFTLRSTPRETTITMDFPAGSNHHLAIKGIKSFNVLFMNGIRWNGDPNFQRYYAGWYYDEVNETLYVKIRHRVKTETIRILYYDPEEVPVTVPDQ